MADKEVSHGNGQIRGAINTPIRGERRGNPTAPWIAIIALLAVAVFATAWFMGAIPAL
jgi:hypothetical protein